MDLRQFEKLQGISVEDVYERPNDYGLPTFDEFSKNPEKYIGRSDEVLSSADAGGETANQVTRKHIYEIEGYRCKTIEEVERVARNQGIPIESLDYRPMFLPLGAGKADVLVKFVPKTQRVKRNAWR